MTLLTVLFAVGCSNNSAKSDNSDAKSSQTSKKSHHKTKKHQEKHTEDSDNEDSESSNQSSNSDSTQTNNATNSQQSSNSNMNNSNSNNQSSNTSNSNDQLGEQNFKLIVNDTIKRDQYPAGTGLQDFEVRGGNGVYSVAEKKTGAVINNYVMKNGKIYYKDVATGKETPLN